MISTDASNVRSAKASGSNKSRLKADESRVKVAVRCRPISEKEISNGHQSIVEFEDKDKIVVHDVSASPSDHLGTKSGERQNSSRIYYFDAVFDCGSNQKEVYDQVCKPIVDSVLEGYNGTIFAYGQTGTGKTYTMEGAGRHDLRRYRSGVASTSGSAGSASGLKKPSIDMKRKKKSGSAGTNVSKVSFKDNIEQGIDESAGIIPRAFEQIFEHVNKHSNVQFLIRASYLEIYQEEIHDLLKKDRSIKLELHERPDTGVYVRDLTSFVCKSITEIERVMKVGNQNRMVGATDMNEHSSRSHAIFMITVEQQQRSRQSRSNSNSTITDHEQVNANEKTDDKRVIRVGKLNLVDLAGSERQRKTNSLGQRQRESIKINLSLSALGNVINSLMSIHSNELMTKENATIDNNNKAISFTPYRDSKLTRLLQDSLGGNAKTLMIANIGPASYNYDETINTLNYASRAKCIRNCPRLNEDPKDALLRELQREIDDLRIKLAAISKANVQKNPSNKHNTSHKLDSDLKQTKGNKLINKDIVEKELSELKQKLRSLEGKLLNGGSNESQDLDHKGLLQGYTNEQQLELEKRRTELADQADRERAIRDELERREEAELLALESFSSIQQEVDAKRRLIRQIHVKIRAMRDHVEATQKGYRLELDELDQLQYVLHKELKLKCLIMDNFIPNNHVDQLLSRIVYDDVKSCCQVTPIDLPLNECKLDDQQGVVIDEIWSQMDKFKRPKSEFERIGEIINPADIRYKNENLIEPKLYVPEYGDQTQLNSQSNNNNNDGGDDQDDDNADDVNIEEGAEFSMSSRIQTLIDRSLNQRESNIVI